MSATRWLSWGLLWTQAACGAAQVPSPREAAAEYARALQKGDTSQLYARLNAKSRSQLSEQQFSALLQPLRPELATQSAAFQRGIDLSTQTALLEYPDGREVTCVYEAESYRLSSAFPNTGTPEQLLRALQRALAQRNLKAVFDLLSHDTQQRLAAYLDELAESVRFPETLELDVNDEGALIKTRGGHRFKLKQEAGLWKLHDIE